MITRRYKPEVGDIVIGRVAEVHIKNFSWKFVFCACCRSLTILTLMAVMAVM